MTWHLIWIVVKIWNGDLSNQTTDSYFSTCKISWKRATKRSSLGSFSSAQNAAQLPNNPPKVASSYLCTYIRPKQSNAPHICWSFSDHQWLPVPDLSACRAQFPIRLRNLTPRSQCAGEHRFLVKSPFSFTSFADFWVIFPAGVLERRRSAAAARLFGFVSPWRRSSLALSGSGPPPPASPLAPTRPMYALLQTS
jgi:hypothetical protein